MNEQEFNNLINKNKYQVFLFTSPAWLPLFFVRHPWFVINKKGIISKWEVLFQNENNENTWGHLQKNFTPITKGTEIIPFLKYHWGGKLEGSIEGNENSVAQKMADFIENSKENYPYWNKYIAGYRDSNTYAQYVLNHFPDTKLKLPWNCIGKYFK